MRLLQLSTLLAGAMVGSLVLTGCAGVTGPESAVGGPNRQAAQVVNEAAEIVKPALVRIRVVYPEYFDGREVQFVSFGSGTIISPDGTIVTNHHVAGKAVQIVCTLSNREEIPAVLIGTDAATDIAVIRLMPEEPREFPFAVFGDSDKSRVGDPVFALGSPLALSQSITVGILSNTEMVLPETMRGRGFTLDGENVGELVRWFAHDAVIFPGNSGGPLVNPRGEIIGVNEIGFGLGGAIPGNLAKQVANEIIERGYVRRAFLGAVLQPTLKGAPDRRGVLVATVFPDSPAAEAGILMGDHLLSLNGIVIDGRFQEDLPIINGLIANLPIDQEVPVTILRDGEEREKTLKTKIRPSAFLPERELLVWGITARDVSMWSALELARETSNGAAITSVRSGGPAAKAQIELRRGDIILKVNNEPIDGLNSLQSVTESIMDGQNGFVPVVVEFEREAEKLLTVVNLGIDELPPPGREVRRGWLPMETQVFTREIAEQLGTPRQRGVRVSRLFSMRDGEFPFEVGDLIIAIDGEPVDASRQEDADVFETMVRQYRPGRTPEFTVLRDGERMTLTTRILESPPGAREMRRYRNLDFQFVLREATFRDRERPTNLGVEFALVVDSVTRGSWAEVAGMTAGDVLIAINNTPILSIDDADRVMSAIAESRPRHVPFLVRRGASNMFLEMEPTW